MSIQVLRRVWDDKENVCIQVGEGDDGFGILICTPTQASKEFYGDISLTLGADMARQLGQALINCADSGKGDVP